MAIYSFADVAHSSITFNDEVSWERVVLQLLPGRWVQRLRSITQTGNTSLVYMFSEHSRFGHSLGVAFLACQLLARLAREYGATVTQYAPAVAAAALLHDIGHIAPGSHTAFRTWYEGRGDGHEGITKRIIKTDSDIAKVLGSELTKQVIAIIDEDTSAGLPPWTYEIISGGGWNVDRGNWCLVDSIMAGVTYGKYNVAALLDAIVLSDDGHLAIKENRLDAMTHFAIARHSMYRQVYQHRVLLAADTINVSIARRARDLQGKLSFCDATMHEVLASNWIDELPIDTIYKMNESWWRYHLMQWSDGVSRDTILADLSRRLLCRDLFKTIRLPKGVQEKNALLAASQAALAQYKLEERYYQHIVTAFSVQAGDKKQFIPVMLDNGRLHKVAELEPVVKALLDDGTNPTKEWLVVPAAVKARIV